MALGTFKIDDSQWESFKAKAGEDGTNASALLKAFIAAYLSNRIDASLIQGLDKISSLDGGLEQRLVEAIASLDGKIQGIDERLGKLSA